MTAGYSSTPLWKKLGYKPGLEVLADGAPPQYLARLQLPVDLQVRWLTKPRLGISFVHLFCSQSSKLKGKLKGYRSQLAPDGVIWVSWPKKASGVPTDMTEDSIRAVALPLGLVDIKVCAIDEVWSGLKLMIRKAAR